MNNEEDIFEDLDDEIVSSDAMEEQSNDVPSNSNNRNFKLPKNNNPTKIKNNLQSVGGKCCSRQILQRKF